MRTEIDLKKQITFFCPLFFFCSPLNYDFSPLGGWPGGCVSVRGVAGWMCPRCGGGRVDVSPFWGWPGGCLGVLGVAGWMSPRSGGGLGVLSVTNNKHRATGNKHT